MDVEQDKSNLTFAALFQADPSYLLLLSYRLQYLLNYIQILLL